LEIRRETTHASFIEFHMAFPLDFALFLGGWLTILVKAALILGMVGSAIGTIVHLYILTFSSIREIYVLP
jgi:hypothetical protein